MKTSVKLLFIMTMAVLASCSSQRQLANRLDGDWTITEYQVHQANGIESKLENVGVITFRSNGQGSQTFTSAISQMDAENSGDFSWTNTSETVYISGQNSKHRKAWIILDSSRKSQHWRSTDSEGNLQIMRLAKREE